MESFMGILLTFGLWTATLLAVYSISKIERQWIVGLTIQGLLLSPLLFLLLYQIAP